MSEGKLHEKIRSIRQIPTRSEPESDDDYAVEVPDIIALLNEAKTDLFNSIEKVKKEEEEKGYYDGELQFQIYEFWFEEWFGEKEKKQK